MGRLTLNILLSFAQFEREVIGERVRDKIAASRQKGLWMGGTSDLTHDVNMFMFWVIAHKKSILGGLGINLSLFVFVRTWVVFINSFEVRVNGFIASEHFVKGMVL